MIRRFSYGLKNSEHAARLLKFPVQRTDGLVERGRGQQLLVSFQIEFTIDKRISTLLSSP